jgi:hypothetical protein
LAALASKCDILPVDTNEGFAFSVVDKAGKPIKKSASEAYSSIEDFIKEKVVREDWIIKNNQPATLINASRTTPILQATNLLPPEDGKPY